MDVIHVFRCAFCSGGSGSEDYRYTSKPEDPKGLYYYGARYYNPVLGRFITRDTVFGDLTDPQSQNRYVYCMNNPHKYTDPDGKIPIFAGAIIGAAIGAYVNLGFYCVTHRNIFIMKQELRFSVVWYQVPLQEVLVLLLQGNIS